MKIPKEDKFKKAITDFEAALKFEKEAVKNPVYMAAIAKLFETCLEYAWKYFKRVADENGLEVFSPKDSIKMAGQLNLITDVEAWLVFLQNRNLAVHDYLGISNEDYLKSIREFYRELKKLKIE